MKSAGHSPKRKVITVSRGLFLVRYASAEDDANPPVVRVALDPANAEGSGLVLHPNFDEAALWQPGSSLVVRAVRPAKLLVEVWPNDSKGSTAAVVNVEALTPGEPPVAQAPPRARGAAPLNTTEVRLLGHVAGIGDVVVAGGEWLAGPSAPSRIEGIAIEWPQEPHGIDISYTVNSARSNGRIRKSAELGSFAGTRGRAEPITSLTLEMSGTRAEALQFSVEALFLGSPTMRASGRRIVLGGVTGREPLVGLRLSIEKAGKAKTRRPVPVPQRPASSGNGVQVFRGRARQREASL